MKKNALLQQLENDGLMIFDEDFLPDELDLNKRFILSEFDRFIDWLPEEEGEVYSIELPIINVGKSEQGILYNPMMRGICIELECCALFGKYTDEIDVIVKDIWCY